MSKQLILFSIVVILICVGFSGCNQLGGNGLTAEENRFIGKWSSVGQNESITFFSDATTLSTISGIDSSQWKLKGDELVFFWTLEGTVWFQQVYDYKFLNNDNTLSITSIDTGIREVWIKE